MNFPATTSSPNLATVSVQTQKSQVVGPPKTKLLTFLFDTMYSLIFFRKSTPPQNRQLHILITNSKQ